jgi:hypothetical protein
LHHARMSAPTFWILVFTLLVAVLPAINLINLLRLRQELRERDRHDEAVERQVADLLAQRRPRPPDGPDEDGGGHRHLRSIPPAAVAVLAGVVGWLRRNPAHTATAAMGTAAVTVAVAVGSTTAVDDAMPEPPQPSPILGPPTTTEPTPGRTTVLTTSATTRATKTRAPTRARVSSPALTAEMAAPTLGTPRLPIPAPAELPAVPAAPSVPPLPTVPTMTTPMTTTAPPSMPTTPAARCLLKVQLKPALSLCVPA